ncbi:hypothetical protein [Jiangella gansuensis]|uniref:hypothetical protein n=1 Tax=Jiangella gansuensis TaxID=281473 RepID=UPI0004B06C0A|nr:hypothetical protein [Jiangella gansuensis]
MYRVLCCDSCSASTLDTGQAGGWFVFIDAGSVAGNARCPDCLPDQSEPWSLPDPSRL